jgi:hypothetical protein
MHMVWFLIGLVSELGSLSLLFRAQGPKVGGLVFKVNMLS